MSKGPWRKTPAFPQNLTDYPPVMTPAEVGKLLRITPEYAVQMAREGRLPATKVGNRWRFMREDVESYLKGGRTA